MLNTSGYLIGITVYYKDGNRKSIEIALPGNNPESIRLAAISLVRRSASRPIDDITAVIIGPANAGQFPSWLANSLHSDKSFTVPDLGL